MKRSIMYVKLSGVPTGFRRQGNAGVGKEFSNRIQWKTGDFDTGKLSLVLPVQKVLTHFIWQLII